MQISEQEVIKRLEDFGYEPSALDTRTITYCINSVSERICNYCNVDEVPDNFKYEAIDAVCADFLGIKLAVGTFSTAEIDNVVSKIQEGDTTVEFGDTDSPETKLKKCLDTMVLKYCSLNRFRRMVW